MKVNHAAYLATAVREDQFPKTELPEVVFAGRSNVGKSSIINMLVSRKKLAYFSSKPGKTQTLNFYQIDEALIFVDVPGYGYAKVPEKIKASFAAMIQTYFETREQCVGVCLLVDFRHKPTADDIQMYEFLRYYEIPMIIICTKADKISKNKYAQHIKMIKDTLGITAQEPVEFVITSAETAMGKKEAWNAVLALLKK